MNLKKILIGCAAAVMLVGGLLFSAVPSVLANTDGENAILGFLRVTVMAQFEGITGLFQRVEDLNAGRFDTIDAKLDRIYASCGRTPATARRVTTAQVNTCVSACYTSAATPQSAGGIDPARFVSCVSRCPSNTLRNQECAQRYTRQTQSFYQSVVQEYGRNVTRYTSIALTPARFGRECADSREARFAGSCQVYAETLSSSLTACLADQTAYTCQQDCDGNYRNHEGLTLCLLRCGNRARAVEVYDGLRESGFLNEQGRLSFEASSVTDLNLGNPQAQNPLVPSTNESISNIPVTRETYSQCVYRCDSTRTACLNQVPQPTTCQSTYESCYLGCGALLTGGAAR